MSMLSKRDLGLIYLAGTGGVLSIVIIAASYHSLYTNELQSVFILSGAIPSLSLIPVQYWLGRSPLDGDQIWAISKWGALGMGLLTLFNFVILSIYQITDPVIGWGMSILISNVAAGGLTGVLVGGVWEHAKHSQRLSEKNAVLNRVLRHDLRNSMGVIRAHAEILESRIPDEDVYRIALIKRKVDEIIELSETAREIQTTLERDQTTLKPVNAVAIIQRQLKSLRETYPSVSIDTEMPSDAWVYADTLLESVIDNVLQNAIIHNNEPIPRIHISIATNESSPLGIVTITIRDNGPGVPNAELAVLSDAVETPLEHSSGTGLWIVKWLVDHYGGSVSYDHASPSGTVVEITLRSASPSPVFSRVAQRYQPISIRQSAD